MSIPDRISELQGEIKTWRHELHGCPELLYDVHRTASVVADKLRSFGCDSVTTGIAKTGVVAVITGSRGSHTRTVGLRADMDALPIQEATGLPYASTTAGKMHACGHDGHTAMLLGAAKYLCETRNFAGSAVLIFQPAEEGGAGAKAMIDEGVLEKYCVDEVYALHNCPGMAIGSFGIQAGPFMASVDYPTIEIEGAGAHAASPHLGVDPILIGAQIVNAVQAIVSRQVDPLEAAVISITQFEGGTARSVIPSRVRLGGTVRCLSEDVRSLLETRLQSIVEHIALSFGAKATFTYERSQPVLVNDARATDFAAKIAQDVSGVERVDTRYPPVLAGEDFAFMLNARPGALIWVGNGPSKGLHNPEYDFNDDAIPYGVAYWSRLVETALRP